MKKLLLLALPLMMIGCDDPKTTGMKNGYSIIEIDSCEYLRGLYSLSHKGNCKYCQQRRKQEIKDLIEELKK